jgi:hypothetical protein
MTLPDVDSLAILGGALQNYAPVEDPTTDLDAGADNKSRCDVAAMTHTLTRTWVNFQAAATTGAMVLVAHDSVWGNTAPVTPTLARTSAGIYTITFPTSVTDELGVAHTTNLRASWGNSRGGVTQYTADCSASGNVITAYVYNSAGTLTDAVGVGFDVYAL